MTKYKVYMDKYEPWTIKADHVAYEGDAIIFYDTTPYDPKVIIRRDAHVVRQKDGE